MGDGDFTKNDLTLKDFRQETQEHITPPHPYLHKDPLDCDLLTNDLNRATLDPCGGKMFWMGYWVSGRNKDSFPGAELKMCLEQGLHEASVMF